MSQSSASISAQALKTRVFKRNESLKDFICAHVGKDLIREGMILAVTSKIVSLAEGCLVPHSQASKKELIRKEADTFLGEVGYGSFLTIKHGLLLISAGIDESNSQDGEYILYPKDPFASAAKLCTELREAWGLKDLGVIFTDSHSSPLRRGVTGIALCHCGFRGVRNMIGSEDLFGRELRLTQMNLVDGLAALAVLLMGEGDESRPLAVIHGANVEFGEGDAKAEIQMPLAEDMYLPLIQSLLKR